MRPHCVFPSLRTAWPVRRRAAAASGFTLLEVLVAVVVLSFGILGVVGLQAASLHANREARLQSSAARLGRELADLMRGNKDIALIVGSGNPYLVDFTGTVPDFPQNCFSTKCTTSLAVAQFQISDWLNRANVEMPGAHVKVCFDNAPYASTGTATWDCTDPKASALPDQHDTQAVVKIGWTQLSTNRRADAQKLVMATTPSVVLPLIAGSVQ